MLQPTYLIRLSAPFTAFAAAAPSATPTCYNYVLISSRGTREPGPSSSAFPGMIKTTLATVPNGIEYDNPYPATDLSQDNGTAYAVNYIDAGLKSCPNQKYALLGYSQGAIVTSQVLAHYSDTNSAGFKAIRAALVAGNPAHEPCHPQNVDQTGGNSTNGPLAFGILYPFVARIPAVWYNTTKVLDICYFDDPVCNGLFAVTAGAMNHFKYGNTSSVQNVGAKFLANLLARFRW